MSLLFSWPLPPSVFKLAPATFAGGGYTADDITDATDTNGTYDKSDGDLVINGKNFRATTVITLNSATVAVTGGTFNVDPVNPPAGITFNAAGTQITISKNVIPVAWIGIDTADVTVTTTDTQTATSWTIQTQE
jgi:hypothetical protein